MIDQPRRVVSARQIRQEKNPSTSAGRTAGPVLLALALAGGGAACHETDDEKR